MRYERMRPEEVQAAALPQRFGFVLSPQGLFEQA